MINAAKKDHSCMLNWAWFRNFISFITSSIRLAIYNRNSYYCCWNYVDNMLNKRRVNYMTIVVKKVPKFLRGIVKLIFGIKDKK